MNDRRENNLPLKFNQYFFVKYKFNEKLTVKNSSIIINSNYPLLPDICLNNVIKEVFVMTNYLSHDPEARLLIQNIRTYADSENKKYIPDYIYELNEICPSCQKEIERNFENKIDYGSIRACVYEDYDYVIPYAICKSCASDDENSKSAPYKLEDYLLLCLGLY